ncbi:hypothetical protein K8I61_14715 [bacterium]|nr:hypothetical protein [bacterium]
MQEVFWNDHHDREHYTSELVDLLAYDRTLTHDPSVTFEFLHASISRYTFTTRHANGNTTYTWTD